MTELKRQTALLAKGLQVVGLMNVQFAIQPTRVDGRLQDIIFVLEVNPRASRSVPFVSKATGLPLAKIAARCMVGQSLDGQGLHCEAVPPYFSVKEVVFPFAKFPGVDTILGPEMKSTGEVMGVGQTFGEAFYKSQLAAGVVLPAGGAVYLRVKRSDQARAVVVAQQLENMGYTLLASEITNIIINAAGVKARAVDDNEVLEMLSRKEIALMILTVDEMRSAVAASRALRVAALCHGIPLSSTIAGAEATLEGLRHMNDFQLYSMQALHEALPSDMRFEHVPHQRGVLLSDSAGDLSLISDSLIERRKQRRKPDASAPLINLFIRQPFTESNQEQQRLINDVLMVIDSANGAPYAFNYLTGNKAESAATFKKSFEHQWHRPFTPKNFRDYRLGQLDHADVFINIRVGMSESSAFELGYHIFKGRRTPILFLVWKKSPIKTTLIRELDDLCDVTYIEFDEVNDLRRGIHQFFSNLALSPQPAAAASAANGVARS